MTGQAALTGITASSVRVTMAARRFASITSASNARSTTATTDPTPGSGATSPATAASSNAGTWSALARSIAAIARGLDRSYREDGAADGVGRFIVRIARVLKLDGIALLETSQTGSFQDEMEIRRSIAPGEYGAAIQTIDALVLDLHRVCAQRSGRLPPDDLCPSSAITTPRDPP